jgi:hypothetical protein
MNDKKYAPLEISLKALNTNTFIDTILEIKQISGILFIPLYSIHSLLVLNKNCQKKVVIGQLGLNRKTHI